MIQTDIRTAIEGARLTVRKGVKTRQIIAPARQSKIGVDKTIGELHIEK